MIVRWRRPMLVRQRLVALGFLGIFSGLVPVEAQPQETWAACRKIPRLVSVAAEPGLFSSELLEAVKTRLDLNLSDPAEEICSTSSSVSEADISIQNAVNSAPENRPVPDAWVFLSRGAENNGLVVRVQFSIEADGSEVEQRIALRGIKVESQPVFIAAVAAELVRSWAPELDTSLPPRAASLPVAASADVPALGTSMAESSVGSDWVVSAGGVLRGFSSDLALLGPEASAQFRFARALDVGVRVAWLLGLDQAGEMGSVETSAALVSVSLGVPFSIRGDDLQARVAGFAEANRVSFLGRPGDDAEGSQAHLAAVVLGVQSRLLWWLTRRLGVGGGLRAGWAALSARAQDEEGDLAAVRGLSIEGTVQICMRFE